MPARGLFSSVFTIDHFDRLMPMVVRARFAMMLALMVFLVLSMVMRAFAGNDCVRGSVGITRGRVTVGEGVI